jgi:hypothetical protein
MVLQRLQVCTVIPVVNDGGGTLQMENIPTLVRVIWKN